ncbi:MAG: hypothetical protein Kow0010_07680 [Dehalococcoidia bacterium]
MGRNALTHADDGSPVAVDRAVTWSDWVSASATRNFAIDDPILDWLNLYGEGRGFVRDDRRPGYDERTDFTAFVLRQGERFEAAVVALLRKRVDILRVAVESGDTRRLDLAEETFAAMQRGVPAIHQGVLWDAEHRTYGAPDLLVRSDVLHDLFPGTLTGEEARFAAPALGGPWHYRVVDIKFTTLDFDRHWQLANGGSSPAYKAQLYVYNRALGRLQGWTPPFAYLLGRGWKKGTGETAERGQECMDRLAPVPQAGTVARGVSTRHVVDLATRWVRRVRQEGGAWTVDPAPSVPELYPDMKNTADGPWHFAKKEIADRIGELTLLWQVGAGKRRAAHAQGIFDWRDRRVTPAVVGVSGEKLAPRLAAILDVNRSADGPPVRPRRVRAGEERWRQQPRLEFYVDYETVSDLADDFSQLPKRGGQPLIFMIGCGHVEGGAWRFASFVADGITEESEAAIIDAWFAHMREVKDRVDPDGPQPLVIHWSRAERSSLSEAYDSARNRQPNRGWQDPNWFDFLNEVVRKEPVVIRGALGFGLKYVARALHEHGLIETCWEDGPSDGLGAMVGAWWCAEEARRLGCGMGQLELMQEIARYNEVDCRVMMECVRYLRTHH